VEGAKVEDEEEEEEDSLVEKAFFSYAIKELVRRKEGKKERRHRIEQERTNLREIHF
jgi:hypothetical protein